MTAAWEGKFPESGDPRTLQQPSQFLQQARSGLKTFWGYEHFRPMQGEIVTALLERQDALVMLPTGAGKSLCFQLPALVQDGLSVVVCPLVALMENQVQALQSRQAPAALLHSEQSREQRQQTLHKLKEDQLKLLYLAPESLLSPTVWKQLLEVSSRLRSLIIDEAHCITQWGSSFRPAYRRLGTVRAALQPNTTDPISIAAFTATADPIAQRDIQQVLGLKKPQVFRTSPYRKNLFLRVARVWTPASRRDRLQSFIQAQGATAGLVYTRSRRDSETLVIWLQEQGHGTAAYHAGLSAQQRRRIEQQWLSGQMPFVICTSAFGMGVDKSDVRWICHFHPPLALAEYLQEIGRAGRNGEPAQTLLLASEPTGLLDPTDKERREGFLKQMRSQTQLAQKLVQKLPREGYLPDVLKQEPQAELALAILHQQNQLIWVDPFHFRLLKSTLPSPRSEPQTSMEAYLATKQCRWAFLLGAFGFAREAQGLRCENCDRCQHSKLTIKSINR